MMFHSRRTVSRMLHPASCLVFAALCAANAGARTVSITGANYAGGTATSFDLALSAGDASEELYIAYGEADGGDTPAGWEHFDKIADIPAATTAYTAAAPAGWGTTAHYLRFFMKGLVSNPYDYLVEYLPSSGSGDDYLDTGCVPTSETKVEIDYTFYGNGQSGSTSIYIFGERNTMGQYGDSLCIYHVNTSKQLSLMYADISTGNFNSGLSGTGERLKLTVVGSAVDGDGTLKIYGNDGTTLYTRANTNPFTSSHGRTMLLFASREGTAIGNRHPRADLYSLRIWEGGELVRDYAPAVVNGVAGLWDFQNGTFTGSATSTAFTAGPKIAGTETTTAFFPTPATIVAAAKPSVIAGRAVATGYTAATVSWELASVGTAQAAEVSIRYGVSSDNLSASRLLAPSADLGSGTALLDGLTPGRLYYGRLVATADGVESDPSPVFSFEIPLPATAAGGDARTFTGVEISGRNAIAHFTTYEVATSLYAAYGAEYGGETTNGWEHVVKVADVAGDATSQSFALPAGWGASSKFLRFFMVVDGSAAGGEFLDYIEADGGQWFNTGIYPDSNLVVKATFSTTDTANRKILFAEYGGGFNFGCYLANNAGTTTRALMGKYGDFFVEKATGKEPGQKWTFTLGMSVGSLADDTQMNGSEGYHQSGGTTAKSRYPLYLMAYLSDGSIRSGWNYYGRFYDFRAYSEDVLIQHLVPFAKGGETNLLNVVTGAILPNIGPRPLSGAPFGDGAAAPAFFTFSDLLIGQDAALPSLGTISASGEGRGDRVTISGTIANEGAGNCSLFVDTSRSGAFDDAFAWEVRAFDGASFAIDLYSADTSSAAYIRPGETTWYRVRLIDGNGNSDATAPASFTTRAASALGTPSATSAGRIVTVSVPVVTRGANDTYIWVQYGTDGQTFDGETAPVVVNHDNAPASVTLAVTASGEGTLHLRAAFSNDCSTAFWTGTSPSVSRTVSNNLRYTWKKSVPEGIWEDAANWDAPEGRLDYPTAASEAYFLNGTTTGVEIASAALAVRQLYVYERNIDAVFHGGLAGTGHKLTVSENLFADATGGTICFSNLQVEVTKGGVTVNQNRLLKICGGAEVAFFNGGSICINGGPGRHLEVSGGAHLRSSGELRVGGSGSTAVIDDAQVSLYAIASGISLANGADGGEIILTGKAPLLETPCRFRNAMDRAYGGTLTFVVPEGGYARTPIRQSVRVDNGAYWTVHPFASEGEGNPNRVKPLTIRIDPASPALSAAKTLRQPLISWKNGLAYDKLIAEAPTIGPRSNRLAYAAEFDAPYTWESSWDGEEARCTIGLIHEHRATVLLLY